MWMWMFYILVFCVSISNASYDTRYLSYVFTFISFSKKRILCLMFHWRNGAKKWVRGVVIVLVFQSLSRVHLLCPHGLQHARLPCPSPSPGPCSNSCPSSRWYHSIISCSDILFFCFHSFPASGFFPVNQLIASGGQRGVLEELQMRQSIVST